MAERTGKVRESFQTQACQGPSGSDCPTTHSHPHTHPSTVGTRSATSAPHRSVGFTAPSGPGEPHGAPVGFYCIQASSLQSSPSCLYVSVSLSIPLSPCSSPGSQLAPVPCACLSHPLFPPLCLPLRSLHFLDFFPQAHSVSF